MSVPSCAKMPVFGAIKPMRNSSAAGAGKLNDAPISVLIASSSMDIQALARFMVVPLGFDSPANRAERSQGVGFGKIPLPSSPAKSACDRSNRDRKGSRPCAILPTSPARRRPDGAELAL